MICRKERTRLPAIPFAPEAPSSPAQRAFGFTLIELVITTAILMILASVALPIARVSVQRTKEVELRRDLLDMRNAIDRYKDLADRNQVRVKAGTDGYPPDLETLVDGVPVRHEGGGQGRPGVPQEAAAGGGRA